MTSSAADRAAFLDTLMDAAVDAIVIIDRRGAILRFNRSAERMFGYTEAEVLGRNVNVLMPEPAHSRHDEYLARYLETGKAAIIGIGRVELGLRRNGESFPMRLSVGESRQGDEVHFVGIIHDLSAEFATEEKMRRLEQQLVHADRLVTLGELTAGIAHEINQPLTAIAAYADAGRQLAHKSAPGDDALQKVCARIAEQSRRAAAVISRLRKMVRSGGGTKSRHDINEIIRAMLPLFDHEVKNTGIRIAFEPVTDLPGVYVDDIQIQQVLANLIKNSLDALLEAGLPDGRVEIRIARRGDALAIVVEDNGPGVPPSDESRLFEPFHTSKAKGVGLGLSIAKSIAVAHGGSLIHVRPGERGARFVLTLPLASIG